MTEVLKGLTLSFYRDADPMFPDCTNGGISGQFSHCVLVGIVDYRPSGIRPGLPDDVIRPRDTTHNRPEIRRMPKDSRVFSPTDDRPPVWLVLNKSRDGGQHYIPGNPETGLPDLDRWYSAGGNYATTTDSRLSELLGHMHAVRVHDRYEPPGS